MSLTASEKQQIMKEHQAKENDTGTAETQVALLTEDIKQLTEHFKLHKHDYHSRQGLLQKVEQRRKLLKYLKKQDLNRYQALIKRLGLREV